MEKILCSAENSATTLPEPDISCYHKQKVHGMHDDFFSYIPLAKKTPNPETPSPIGGKTLDKRGQLRYLPSTQRENRCASTALGLKSAGVHASGGFLIILGTCCGSLGWP